MRISWFTLALSGNSHRRARLAFEHDYGTPLMGVVWSGSGAELALSISTRPSQLILSKSLLLFW